MALHVTSEPALSLKALDGSCGRNVNFGHGEMDVYVDDQKLATVNTQSPSRNAAAKRFMKQFRTTKQISHSDSLAAVSVDDRNEVD